MLQKFDNCAVIEFHGLEAVITMSPFELMATCNPALRSLSVFARGESGCSNNMQITTALIARAFQENTQLKCQYHIGNEGQAYYYHSSMTTQTKKIIGGLVILVITQKKNVSL